MPAGLEHEVEQYAEHEVLRAILDQGGDPRAFERQYEDQLRAAELESIQDYILESDNLAALHEQVALSQGALSLISARVRGADCNSDTVSACAKTWTSGKGESVASVLAQNAT